MKSKTIKIPIYFGEIILLQMENLKDIEKKYNMIDLHKYDAIAFPHPTKRGYSRYVIACRKPIGIKAIVHECCHTANYILSDRNIKYSAGNDEQQAYLLGWIVGECLRFLKIKKS